MNHPTKLYLLILVLVLPSFHVVTAQETQALFNGTDLTGWTGTDGFWKVEDGAIVGETTKEKPTKGNTFLIWRGGDVSDFEFNAKVRFKGNNSGVQYRSEEVSEHVLKGLPG